MYQKNIDELADAFQLFICSFCDFYTYVLSCFNVLPFSTKSRVRTKLRLVLSPLFILDKRILK